jgi:hypothetical protein
VSPAFSLGRARVTYEFPNRRSNKIFGHRLGNITFQDGLSTQLNDSRNDLINEVYGERGIGGYRYKPVSHTYIRPTLIGSDLIVLGHGAPRSGGYENCVLVGAQCADGTDTQCEVGKCEVGRLSRVSGTKWRYDSLTVPGLYYFVFGTERVELKPVVRGRFSLPAGAGVIDVIYPASPSGTIYLPLNTYNAETFTRRVVRQVFSGTTDDLRLITDSVDNFARGLLGLNKAEDKVEQEVKDRLLDLLYSTTDISWHPSLFDTVEGVWTQRYEGIDMTNRDFAFRCYEQLTTLYNSGLQIAMSGLKVARVVVDQEIGRPVYGRLPGISGAYNTDEEDKAAKWLTSGADSELSGSKTLIDTFYRTFLDPATCYPLNLDWIAQHMGFIGGLWNLEWSVRTKRTLIANAHVNKIPEGGMWTKNPESDTLRTIDLSRIERIKIDYYSDPSSTTYIYKFGKPNYPQTPSGYRFGGLDSLSIPPVYRFGETDPDVGYRFGELDTSTDPDTYRFGYKARADGLGNVLTLYKYSSKVYDSDSKTTSIVPTSDLVVDMGRWQGILPSRGSLLTLLFMFWAFDIKSNSPEELVYDPRDYTFSVRSGLRSTEISAPINVPYIVDTLKVGDDTDAEVYNYPNQLIADTSTCQDELSANTTVVRMPFYYNRNGRSWDAAQSILENYAPETSIKRIQYPYANADLLVCEDVFFEPVVE